MFSSERAAARMEDLLRPKTGGEMINPHIVAPVRTPRPNFDLLRDILADNAKLEEEHILRDQAEHNIGGR